ncbi:MAG: hypothetical protein K2X39_02095, partial [Silvanigrellaceae bacterium]|nr:hypothetical protein [Silvanigrellaceae bacterium]
KISTAEALIIQFEKLCDYINQENHGEIVPENAIIEQLNTIYQALLLLDFDEEPHSLQTLSQLKKIEETTNQYGRDLLEKCLLSSRFQSVEQLLDFSASLDLHYFMAYSLQNRNSELLRFLIRTFSIPVNTFPLSMDETYPSALEFCIQTHTKKNPLVECASVLVAEGADVLLPDSKTGLPIAHFLLCEGPKHPLFKILETNCKQTLENRKFYDQLIMALTTHLQTPNLSKGRIQAAKRAIQKYQNAAEKNKLHSSYYFVEKNLREAVLDNYKYSDELVEALTNDEEIQALQKNILDTVRCYKMQWEASQYGRNKPFPMGSAILNSDTKMCTDFIKNSPSLSLGANCTVEDHKRGIFKDLTSIQEYLKTAMRLLFVQDKLVRSPKYQRPSKNQKQLAAEEQRLIVKIKEIKPNLPGNVLKNAAIATASASSQPILGQLGYRNNGIFSFQTPKELSLEDIKNIVESTPQKGSVEETLESAMKSMRAAPVSIFQSNAQQKEDDTENNKEECRLM